MKRYFLLVIAMLCTLSAAAFATGQTWAESYGFGSYGGDAKPTDDPYYGSGFDVPVGMANMPDGGYVVAGQLDLPELYTPSAGAGNHTSANSMAGIVRFGPDGTILWQRVLRQTNDKTDNGQFFPATSHVYSIAADASGNIFICGGKSNTSNGGQQPFVAKFSAAGALVWDNGIKEVTWVVGDNPPTFQAVPTGAPFNIMTLTNDGGVLVGTTVSKPSGTQTRPLVAKFNSDGSLAMFSVYELPVQYIGVSAVGQAKNSANYLFAINHPQSGSYAPNPHGMTLVEIAPSGQILRQSVFSPDDGRIETPLQIIATADGGIATFSQLAKGFSGGVIGDAGGFLLRKFDVDTNGTLKLAPTFQKSYGRVGPNSAFYASYLSQTSDGGFLIGGHNSSFVSNDGGLEEASLTRVSATGQLLSVSLLGASQNEGGNFPNGPSTGTIALQAADGGYAFTCATNSYQSNSTGGGFTLKPDWWIVKTDANRRVQNFKDNMRDQQLDQFTVKDSVQTGDAIDISRIPNGVVTGVMPTSVPAFALEDPAQNAAPNAPTVKYQAAPFIGDTLAPVSEFIVKAAQLPPNSGQYNYKERWRFEAIDPSTTAGLKLRVQYSKTPAVEGSWNDLPAGGQMTLVDATRGYWALDTTGVVPEAGEPGGYFFFRVLASAAGYDDVTGPAYGFNDQFAIAHNPLTSAPTVSITAPADNSSALENTSLTVTADAASPDYGIASVTFLDNGQTVARIAGSPFTTTLDGLTAGLHVLTAIATDFPGQQTISQAVSVFVNITGGVNYTYTSAGQNWNDPANWTPTGVPGPNDSARILQGTATVSQATTVKVLSLEGGKINGAGSLTVTSHFTATAGQLDSIPLTIAATATAEVVAEDRVGISSNITNNGLLVFAGDVTGVGLNTNGTVTQDARVQATTNSGGFFGFLQNLGRILFAPKSRRTTTSPALPAPPLVRFGSLSNAGRIVSTSGAGIITNDGGSIQGDSNAKAATASPGFVQTAGELDLGSGNPLEQTRIFGNVTINGGVLTGSGAISGSLINNSGVISPGHSAGKISVDGDFTQAAGGRLVLEVGPSFGDQLAIGGTANLGGALDVNVNSPAQLSNPTIASLFTFQTVNGSFASVSSNAQLSFDTFTATVSVNPTKPSPQTGQPLNISTRMKVLSGDNILIGGFIVYDPSGANAQKKVLIRALGPSLPVSGTLADPLLELHNPDGSVVTNDNWQQGDTTQIPNGFAPTNPKESLLVATLAPGAYTAQVKGAHGETGVGLVEVYDLDSTSTAKLANISTRGFVDTGDNVMIGGFIVGGQDPNNPLTGQPGKVLVRGIGPSLVNSGVSGALAATTLELHDQNGAVISNQGWRRAQESEIIATAIPPQNDKDCAILATLTPGAYTAVLRGSNNTTGIGLIEAYNLQ